MNYNVKLAKSPAEFEAILKLRYEILRKPWNQSIESASDNLEEKSLNAYIADLNGNVIACGRLQENENKTGQIRFMAVSSHYQGQGLGKLIVDFLEQKGQEMQLDSVELQARENAVKFYENCGYRIKEKTFLLWGIIQHYLMIKKLKN